MQACLARKASSRPMMFIRTDYPEMDPPEWRKWITLKQEGGEVKIGDMPLDFYEPLKENYKKYRE
jgi:succinate dehydrogenase/fumarate reductase flavoprotein subunit